MIFSTIQFFLIEVTDLIRSSQIRSNKKPHFTTKKIYEHHHTQIKFSKHFISIKLFQKKNTDHIQTNDYPDTYNGSAKFRRLPKNRITTLSTHRQTDMSRANSKRCFVNTTSQKSDQFPSIISQFASYFSSRLIYLSNA